MTRSIDTPCIGICSTVYGDDVCRGCKRLYQEVIDWNAYDEQMKEVILLRLHVGMSSVVKNFLKVTDADLLLKELHAHQIRYQTQDPYCLAHHLLRVRGAKIIDIKLHGIEINLEYQALSLVTVFTLIDKKLLEIAEAHALVTL